jgi:hypothetical protein
LRRLLVPSVLVLTLLALGAWSGSAAAIVCPEVSGNVAACCGPVTPNPGPNSGCCPSSCCGTSACCGASPCCGTGAAEPACPVMQITISSTPEPSVAGHRVTISGQRTGAASGVAVELWQELPGQASFQRVAQTTTNSGGQYAFVRVAQTDASWYTKADGAISATLAEHVRAAIGFVAHARGDRIAVLSGHVAPGHAGERIILQQHTATGWRTIATTRLGSKSKFSLRHRFAHGGAATLRAVFGGDARNVRSTSAPVGLNVR